MRRFLSIALAVFLIFSASSAAFAYEYDFATDLEKFTESVSKLIAENKTESEYDSDVFSGSSELYFSDKNSINSNDEITDSYTNRLIVKSSENIDTLNAVNCVSGYNDLYILQFSNSEDYLSAYKYYSGLDSVEFLQEDMYCSVQTTEESTTALTESTTESITEPVTEEGSDGNTDIEEVFNPTKKQSDIFGFTGLRNHLIEEGVTYSDTIEVAVIDTGVANNHPMFKNRIEPTGFNSVDSEDDCFDDYGHGTHVAGIIVANTGDNVVIKPYKVLDSTGKGSDLQVYLGIEQAIADGVDIINLSLSRRGYSDVLYEAVTHAEEEGVVIVASAGNKGVDLAQITYSPSDFDEVVTVASCTDDFYLSDFSNYGGKTDIIAPGNSINSAAIDGGYTVKSGTSMSAGFISAAVSYLLLQFPEYTRVDIEEALFYNTKPCKSVIGTDCVYVEYLNKEKEVSPNPVFSYKKSLFSDPFELEITCEDETAEIYYRTSMMQEGEYQLYTDPIPVSHDLTVHAFTLSKGSIKSSPMGYAYTRRPQTDTSVFTVDSNGVLTGYTGTDMNIVLPNYINGITVKSVASDVFRGNTGIKSIAFSGYTTEIPDSAFEGCTNLEFVRIKGVTTIGDSAFSGCSNLKCVVSDKLTEVGDFAFYNCRKLNSLIFTLVSDIGKSAFENTASLKTIGVNSFENISERAFYNSTISEISLNNALTIGDEAFYGCKNLKYISGPRVTDIGESAFYDCKNIISVELDSLTNLGNCVFTGIESLELFSGNSLTSIPDDSFKDCIALTDVSFCSVETIGANAFLNTKLATAIFNNAISIGENAFGGCSELTEISFNSLSSVNFSMFFESPEIKKMSFEKVTRITFDNETEFSGLNYYFPLLESFSMPLLQVVPENMFKDSNKLTELIFTDLREIGKYAFYNCNAASFDLSGVSEIGEYAFYNCDNINEVLLPAATFVGNCAFSECDNITTFEANLLDSFDLDILNGSTSSLETLSLDGAYVITKSGSSSFSYSLFPKLVNFSAKLLTALQDSAFENCSNVRNVDISSAKALGNKAFKNSGVANVVFPKALSIGDECFRGCLRVTEIDLDSVKSIGDLAFYGCSNISKFSAASIDEFDLNILFGCVKMKSLSIDGAESVRGLEFSDVNTLENLWPLLNSFSANSLINLPQYMFYKFTNIDNISLDSVTEIPESTLTGTSIVTADFPSVTKLSDYAFLDCSALKNVALDNVISIGKDVFNGCSELKSLSLNSLKEIPSFEGFVYKFSDCDRLETVSLNSLEVANDNLFEGCASLKNVSMDAFEIIPAYFFYSCSALETVSLDSVTDIGKYAFAYTGVVETSFESLQRIGNNAFEGCRQLVSFDFSELESIGDYAFKSTGLTKVVMDSPTELGKGVFCYCYSLSEFDFYDMQNLTIQSLFETDNIGNSYSVKRFSWGGVKEVPASFFANCKTLQTVVLYDAEVVGEHAFEYCTSLTSLDAPNLKVIKDYGFYNCTNFDVSENISYSVEELGSYSITRTKNIGNGSTKSIVFPNLKIAYENSFDDVSFVYAKFPAIKEIYDLPEVNDYILIGSAVEEIDYCDDVTSKVIAMEGTPVLEYSDEHNLGWLPYNSENAIITNPEEFQFNKLTRRILDFEAIGFDLKYQIYGANKNDLSDAESLEYMRSGNRFFVTDQNLCKYVFVVARSIENGNSTKIRSDVVKFVNLFIHPIDAATSIGDSFISTEKESVTDISDIIRVDEEMEVIAKPSFVSGEIEYYGTGSTIMLKFNGEHAYSFKEVLYGDVTCDGVVDVLDAARFNNICLENDFIDGYDEGDCILSAADINGDYDINSDDYQLLVNKILAK